MDDWGDPWADDARKTLPALEVTLSGTGGESGSLPGWNDDTKWEDVKSDDADWGDFQDPWNEQVEKLEKSDPDAQELERGSPAASSSTQSAIWNSNPDISQQDQLDKIEQSSSTPLEETSADDQTTQSATEKPLSDAESSMSLPTLHAQEQDNVTSHDEHRPGPSPRPEAQTEPPTPEADTEDADSPRPSTSSSESSSPKSSPGSPRTSVEDERHGAKKTETIDEDSPTDSLECSRQILDDQATGAFINVPEEHTQDKERLWRSSSLDIDSNAHEKLADTPKNPPIYPTVASPESIPRPSVSSFNVDKSIIQRLLLLKPTTNENTQSDADPLASTAAKKAWYRVTRKQTMREFNAGQDDDNYVRGTWLGSHIRNEVDNVVTRWMVEDRATGKATLGRPSAAFGWGQSNQSTMEPSQTNPRRSKTQPSTMKTPPTTSLELQLESSIESPTAPVAQFGWSSTLVDTPSKQAPIEIHESSAGDQHHIPAPRISFASETTEKVRPMSTDLSNHALQFKHRKGSKSVSNAGPPASRTPIDALMYSAAQKTMTISPMVPTEKPAEISLPAFPTVNPTTIVVEDGPAMTMDSHGPRVSLDYLEEEDVWGEYKVSSAYVRSSIDQAPPELPKHSEPPEELPLSIATENSSHHPLDPWASADFSMFDSAPPTPPIPILLGPVALEEQVIVSTPTPTKAQTEASHNQEVVEGIINALPKIDYMLR